MSKVDSRCARVLLTKIMTVFLVFGSGPAGALARQGAARYPEILNNGKAF
jgi:hypothetical protein